MNTRANLDRHYGRRWVSFRSASTDNGIIPCWAKDVVVVLGQLGALNRAGPNGILTGKLNLQRVSVLASQWPARRGRNLPH